MHLWRPFVLVKITAAGRECVRQGQAFSQVYRYSPSQKSDTRQKYSQDNLVLLFFFLLLLSNKLNYSNIHGISYWASSMMDLMSGDWIHCITADTQNFQFNQANFALCWQKGPRSKPIIRLRAILVKQRSLWVTLTSSHVHMRLG